MHGGYGVMVSTAACGAACSGSNPDNRPEGILPYMVGLNAGATLGMYEAILYRHRTCCPTRHRWFPVSQRCGASVRARRLSARRLGMP